MSHSKNPLPHFDNLSQAATESQATSLNELFSSNPNRAEELCFRLGSLSFDFSKTHLTDSVLKHFEELAQNSSLLSQRDRLLGGEIVNPTEQRPALHSAMRSENSSDEIKAQRLASYDFAEKVRTAQVASADGNKYRYIIHLGIGGSALGPQLLLNALGFGHESDFEPHCVANVDGHALQPAMDACDPKQTLVVVASKTFTTTETLSKCRHPDELDAGWRSSGPNRTDGCGNRIAATSGRFRHS